MPDPRFFNSFGPLTIADALRIAAAEALSPADASAVVSCVASVDDPDLAAAVVYIEDGRKIAAFAGKRFGLCLAKNDAAAAVATLKAGPVALATEPRAAFALIASALHRLRSLDDLSMPKARLGESARIHPSAVIGAGAEIGADVQIGPNVVIGPGVIIGSRTIIAEGTSIWCAIVGAGCRFGPGSAIGGPGFGFAVGPKGLARIPQLGRVIVEDDVEIGANACVDRGALGDTIIGASTKIDNLVQIGHNVRLGRACILAAQVGIAGSSILGDRVQCGGHAAISDHLTIGDDARIAGKAGVMSNVPAGETWGGYPARPKMIWLRQAAATERAARKKKAGDNGD